MPAAGFHIETDGDFDDDHVIVRWRVDGGRRLDPAIEALIEAEWQGRPAGRSAGRPLANGPLCRLIDWSLAADCLRLTLGPTDYRAFLGTNLTQLPAIQARHPDAWRDYLADPLAVASTLVSADGWLLLLRRSAHALECPDCYHVAAGYPTPEHDNGLGAISPTQALLAELQRALGLTIAEVTGLTVLGLMRPATTQQPTLLYTARLTLTRAALDARLRQTPPAGELADWHWLNDDAAAIHAFLTRQAGRVSPAGAASLTLHQRRR
jgi:hypothetical protein